MAIDNEKHSKDNFGLRGIWNRSLGRKDLQGNTYLKLFTFEATLSALGFTDKVMPKEERQKFNQHPYTETAKNKEFAPVAVTVLCGLLSVPAVVGTGAVTGLWEVNTEYDQSLSIPTSYEEDGVYSITDGVDQHYVLIKEDERVELYQDHESGTLQLLNQGQAYQALNGINQRLGNMTATVFGEDGQAAGGAIYYPSSTLFNTTIQDISEPYLSNDGNIVRDYEQQQSYPRSIDYATDLPVIHDFWDNVQDVTLTAEYGLSAEELSDIDTDMNFIDGASAAIIPSMIGAYLLFVYGMAHDLAKSRVNANPVNRRRRKKPKSTSPEI